MATFKATVISENRKRNTQMVSVKWDGKTITRHLINWQGKHPDDSLPKQYAKRGKEILNGDQYIAQVQKEIARFNVMKPDEQAALSPVERAAAFTLINFLPELKATLTTLIDSLANDQKANPLIVDYDPEG